MSRKKRDDAELLTAVIFFFGGIYVLIQGAILAGIVASAIGAFISPQFRGWLVEGSKILFDLIRGKQKESRSQKMIHSPKGEQAGRDIYKTTIIKQNIYKNSRKKTHRSSSKR